MHIPALHRDSQRIGYSTMRRLNSAFLLDLIREGEPISRAELARLSGLTKPTVSSQIASLLKRGIVVEDGIGEPDSRGGKPSKLLRFNPSLGNLIAAEITASEVRVRLTDLNGHILDNGTASIRPDRGAGHVLERVIEAINDLLAKEPGRREKLMVVSIAAPGRIDSETGTVVGVDNVFRWSNVSVRKPLEHAFDVPILVENDVKLATLGEMHYGLGQGIKNFILIRLTTGIAAGLVLDGRLYQGTHWTAGEIAHMVFDRSAAAESIDPRGYLESAIGHDRLHERIRLVSPEQSETEQSETEAEDSGVAIDLLKAARLQDLAAAAIIDELESNLGLAVANIAAVVDPELIILTGDLFSLVIHHIRATVEHVIPWPTRIETSALGHEAVLLGAIGAAQDLAHELLRGSQPPLHSDSGKQAFGG